jgi:hypothetical protein
MPILNLVIETGFQGCMKLEILRGFFDVIGPVFITEPKKPFPVFRNAAYFFGKTRISTSTTI